MSLCYLLIVNEALRFVNICVTECELRLKLGFTAPGKAGKH